MRRVLSRAPIGLLCVAVLGAVLTVLPPGPAGAATATVTVAPDADATVAQATPTTGMGSDPTLQVDQSPVLESYLHFTLGGVTGSVTSARLRLRVVNASVNGPAVYPTDPGWTEAGITWATKPAPTGPAAADAGALSANTWVEYDVTSLVHGDGPYAFVLIGTSNDGSDFASRE
ncbi:MAG: acid phosphatase type 7, partial [Actinomycetota bacterium]|nr:acid phosphatase type 7 [Actinomycetota bacterium]